MSILQIQMRMRELGRIRIGQKGAKGAPQKLDRFRFTSAGEALIRQVAEAYGGTPQPWHPADGRAMFEVVTDAVRVPVFLPPQPVSQWMELWSGGGCMRRCNGDRETLSDAPCLCKAEEDEQCKPTTRLNVVLRDIPGLGVWRLETHGWNAAQELPGAADFAAQAQGMIPAFLTLEERVSKANGQTRRYMVPGLDVEVTPAQLMAGQATARAVDGGDRPAIEGGSTDWSDLIDAATTRDELIGIREQAKAAGVPTAVVDPLLAARAAALNPPAAKTSADANAFDANALWTRILTQCPDGWTTSDVEIDFERVTGVDAGAATAADMARYLDRSAVTS